MTAGATGMTAPIEGAPGREAAGSGPQTVCIPFAGGIAGGSHISALKLIQSLDRSRFRPLVVLHSDSGEVADLLRREGVPYVTAPSPHHFGRSPGVERQRGVKGALKALAAQWAQVRFLRRNQVRIVHTNEGPMHLSWALPARLAGAKLVWHHRSNPDARSLRFLAPFLADEVVSVSRYALSQAGALRDRPTTSVIHSPFDTDKLVADRTEARRALGAEVGISAETRVISFFGNFVPRKRPFLFVDVIGELRRIAPEVPVIGLMFGSAFAPQVERDLQARADALGLGEHFRLMGFRYPPEPWIAGSDVNLVTAVEEPFGRSLIEAMLLGTPVVAVASGGNVEAIDDGRTGLLVPPDDAPGIAAVLAGLLREPERLTRISEEARSDALGRFGRERHCAAVSAVYERALGR